MSKRHPNARKGRRVVFLAIAQGLLLLTICGSATAQNFSNVPARLSIERHVEGNGLRIAGDAGVFYTPRVGNEFGQWTNLPSRISNGTNEVLWLDGQGTKFFQWAADDQMRLPAWRDFVEWKLTFNFQPVRRAGTFWLETYADGAGFSYRQSYERARWLSNGTENVESRYFRPVGCFDCYFPQ